MHTSSPGGGNGLVVSTALLATKNKFNVIVITRKCDCDQKCSNNLNKV